MPLFALLLAAVPPGGPAALPDAPPSFGWLALQMLVALAAVCALAWVVLNWGVRKLFRVGPLSRGMVRVHERAALEPRKAVYVVEVAGQFYLVGVAEQGFTLLSALDAERVKAAIAERDAARPPPAKSFAEALRRVLPAKPNKEPPKP